MRTGAAWDGRAHFFAAAAEAMRRILIDHARAKGAVKRGGGRRLTMPFDLSTETPPEELLHLNEALDALAQEDHVKAELVKLRFFAGLSMQQAADVLGISRSTANRHWAYARAWLYGEMRRDEESLESDETSHNKNSH